jgi:hypothetical protein
MTPSILQSNLATEKSSLKVKNSATQAIDRLMAEIEQLENDLETLEQGAPIFYQKMRLVVQPHYTRMETLCRDWIVRLSIEFHKPRLARSKKSLINRFACFIADLAQDSFGANLSAWLHDNGFVDIIDSEASPEEMAAIEETLQDIMNATGFEPPEHIMEELMRSMKDGKPINPEIEAWFHQNEAISESKQSATAPKNRKNKTIQDPEALKKRIYHGLARDLHPDKAEEADREQRTKLMQQLNGAYRSGDMRTLLSLLHIHGSDTMKAGVDAPTMKQLTQALKQQRLELQNKLRQNLARFPNSGLNWLQVLRQEDLQLRVIREEKRRCEEQFAHWKKVIQALQDPKELIDYLKKSDEFLWEYLLN